MPDAILTFPNGFLWGTATAAHQVEGGNTLNDWWAWEQGQGHILRGDQSGRACDWWRGGRWREDFDRAQETGQNAHRLSIEWSRIQPERERWDEQALEQYRQMLLGLRERGLQPMVTLHHFTNPLWLSEMGGWENPETPALFAEFVRRATEALGAHCQLWVTLNEPNVLMSGGYLGGGFPPGKNDLRLALSVYANLVRAHALAYQAIHQLQSDAQVGVAYHWRGFHPANWNPLSRSVARLHDQVFNQAFARAVESGQFDARLLRESIPEAKGTQDFIGLNYYTSDLIRFNPARRKEMYAERYFPKDADLSESGMIASLPAGFDEAIHWAEHFHLPIYITENGVDDSRDDFRRRYLAEHIHQLWRSISHNAPVRGYFHWTLVDNFEWERGWTQHFGLWGLDGETQARIRRPSVDFYAGICRSNGLSTAMVSRYAPDVFERLFPV